MLLVAGVLAFGGLAWINGGPIGNVGTWLVVAFVISGSAFAGRSCVPCFVGRERS